MAVFGRSTSVCTGLSCFNLSAATFINPHQCGLKALSTSRFVNCSLRSFDIFPIDERMYGLFLNCSLRSFRERMYWLFLLQFISCHIYQSSSRGLKGLSTSRFLNGRLRSFDIFPIDERMYWPFLLQFISCHNYQSSSMWSQGSL